ncbi:exodeoxyribonuclease VII large subunit [Corallincola spongiicola]|uniref:Exodeoxyribonuclease 7 large subunit n=1 Tax=Corallincola spongiicola TaxID=2520508 RepID=A0ABY1WKX4_9GAMM|nr:exodeoxyribonuclease VII large subunit [Corallincola spongiicola]TAA40363.1 exodeoxyribonuclease VII large subunit [Corallincola spongiicola]
MSNQKVFSVSTLNRCARQLLEEGLGTVWLQGELSNFVAAASGHWYFSLKDERSQVKGAMFRGKNRLVSLKPKSGLQVLVRAQVSLYEPRGDYQLIIEQMEDAGEGVLKQKFDQLKLALAAEGLFSTEHKQAIPAHPISVGVITSATGAAIHDILSVLKRRNPAIRVVLYPTQVQGDTAAAQIAEAILTANRRNECDLLIVGRGGGSLEDLWAFNEEVVARAIYQSQLPIISAVGHEIDTTIADYVADMRAPTPSAAAEYVSGDQQHQRQQLSQLSLRLKQAVSRLLLRDSNKLQQLQRNLQLNHPDRRLQQQTQRLDELSRRLLHTGNQGIAHASQRYAQLSQRLQRSDPAYRLEHLKTRQQQLTQQLTSNMQRHLQMQRNQWQHQCQELSLVSPLATLNRGYSITRDQQSQQVIKTTTQVMVGQQINSQLNDGSVVSEVIAIQANAE